MKKDLLKNKLWIVLLILSIIFLIYNFAFGLILGLSTVVIFYDKIFK